MSVCVFFATNVTFFLFDLIQIFVVLIGKPMKKMNTAPAVHKTLRISNQDSKNSPRGAGGSRMKSTTKSESQSNEQIPERGSGAASQPDKKIVKQRDAKKTTAKGVPVGSQSVKSEGSVKANQMIRHTSQTNTARTHRSDATQNMIKRIMSQSKAAADR